MVSQPVCGAAGPGRAAGAHAAGLQDRGAPPDRTAARRLLHAGRAVMTLPQSGRLGGREQPQGLPDARAPRLFKVTVFIPAVAIKLLLVAALTAQGLFCTSHHGDRLPSRPEGFAVAMALAPPPTAAPRQSQLSPGGSRRLQPPPLFHGYLIS